MEIMIELSETELDLVSGGAGSATFSFSNTASGTNAAVSGTLNIATTASSASLSGEFPPNPTKASHTSAQRRVHPRRCAEYPPGQWHDPAQGHASCRSLRAAYHDEESPRPRGRGASQLCNQVMWRISSYIASRLCSKTFYHQTVIHGA